MSTTGTPPQVISHPPRPVSIAAIEHELAKFWKTPDPATNGKASAIRACMSNLLVFCSTQEQASLIPDEIDEIVLVHPCRVLLLIGEAQATGDAIEAFVSAHCHLSGDRHEVCSEQLTIQARGDAVRRLPSMARSLLIGDLPTSLWWASHEAPPRAGALFEELEAMTDQVIYSSLAWADPLPATLATASWALHAGGRRPKAADLAWRRLKPWRKLISQSLDPSAMPGALDALSSLAIEHGAWSLPQALLLAGWFASRLRWRPSAIPVRRGVEILWRFDSEHGPITLRLRRNVEGDPEIHNVVVCSRSGGRDTCMTFSTLGAGRLGVSSQGVDAQPRVLTAPQQSRAFLVGLQLQNLEIDPIFRDSLDVARQLAEGLRS